MVEQPGVLRGHAHHHGGVGQVLGDQRGVEAWQEDHLVRAEHGTVECDEEPVDVEDRQRVQQHVVRPEPPDLVQCSCVRFEVGVREHRALRATGRSGRVEHCGQIVGFALDDCVEAFGAGRTVRERAVAVDAEVDHPGVEIVERARSCDDESPARRRSTKKATSLGRVRSVQRHEHRADAQAGEVEGHVVGRLVDLDHHAIADRHAEFAQRARHVGGASIDVAVGERRAAGNPEEELVASIGERSAQGGVQVRVHRREHRTAARPNRRRAY